MKTERKQPQTTKCGLADLHSLTHLSPMSPTLTTTVFFLTTSSVTGATEAAAAAGLADAEAATAWLSEGTDMISVKCGRVGPVSRAKHPIRENRRREPIEHYSLQTAVNVIVQFVICIHSNLQQRVSELDFVWYSTIL